MTLRRRAFDGSPVRHGSRAQREADLAARKKAPSILRLRAVLDEMKRTRSFSEKSFSGNKKQQIVLADRLRKLKPFVLRDGRVLTLIGPEHPVGGEMHLYLDFAIGTPPPREQRSKAAATPAGAHAAGVRRLADAIAQFFERLLLRRSPKEVEKLERTAKKRGLRYALIALFFPIACAGVYYYVSNQLHPYAVTFAPRHLNTRDRPRPRSLFDIPTLTVVRWNDDGPIHPPYEVYKNGRLVARTSSAYFIDEHPTRDPYPRDVRAKNEEGALTSSFAPRASAPLFIRNLKFEITSPTRTRRGRSSCSPS